MAMLQIGAQGPDVGELQRRLKLGGFDPGPQDELYGDLTASAVKKAQQTWGLPVTGQTDANFEGALTKYIIGKQQAGGIPSLTIPQGFAGLGGGATTQPGGNFALGGGNAQPFNANLQPQYDYSSDIRSALQALQNAIKGANVTPQQIVSSPDYLAQKNLLDLQLGEGMAGLRRDLASRGMLRSTPAIQTLAQATTEGGIRAGALIPQMMGQVQSSRQQQIGNALQQLQTLADRQRYEEGAAMDKAKLLQDIANTARQFGLSEAGVTGSYQGKPTFAATQAGQAAAQRQAEAAQTAAQRQTEFDWTKTYQQGQLNKPAAATVRTPKQQYEDTIYGKLAQGAPLTEDEKRFLGVTDSNVREKAIQMAQKDDEWFGADEAAQAALIEKYMRLLGAQAAGATGTVDNSVDWAKQGGYLK
jgi:hypothetical protein